MDLSRKLSFLVAISLLGCGRRDESLGYYAFATLQVPTGIDVVWQSGRIPDGIHAGARHIYFVEHELAFTCRAFAAANPKVEFEQRTDGCRFAPSRNSVVTFAGDPRNENRTLIIEDWNY